MFIRNGIVIILLCMCVCVFRRCVDVDCVEIRTWKISLNGASLASSQCIKRILCCVRK